jgi:hypothetical protein
MQSTQFAQVDHHYYCVGRGWRILFLGWKEHNPIYDMN